MSFEINDLAPPTVANVEGRGKSSSPQRRGGVHSAEAWFVEPPILVMLVMAGGLY